MMNTFIEKNNMNKEETIMKEVNKFPHHRPPHHKPPHERRNCIEFGDHEWDVFMEIFKDEDTASAAMACIYKAPAEMQNMALQYFCMLDSDYEIKEKMLVKKEYTNITNTRWRNPFLVGAEDLYEDVYGEGGKELVNNLEHCPFEIAVLSRLFTYVHNKKKGEN